MRTEQSGRPLIEMAVGEGHIDTVKVLVQHGANVQWKDHLNRPLTYLSCLYKFADMTDLLLTYGLDPNAIDHDTQSPLLDIAVSYNDAATVEVLLKHGANIDTSDKRNTILFVRAVQEGLSEIVDAFLRHGALSHFNRLFGESRYIDISVQAMDAKTTAVFVAHGADIHRLDRDGRH